MAVSPTTLPRSQSAPDVRHNARPSVEAIAGGAQVGSYRVSSGEGALATRSQENGFEPAERSSRKSSHSSSHTSSHSSSRPGARTTNEGEQIVNREVEAPAELGYLAPGTSVPLSEYSDFDLLVSFRSGNERAYAEFYHRHKSEIYTYCVRMMSGDAQLASDVFQEIFIRVYEKAEQFREGTNVLGWLYIIARHSCLNVFRTKHPTERIELHENLASRDRSLAPEYDEEQHFLREKLEESIAKLPVEFREPFIMREFDGFSYSEIAQMTGTTLAVTKVRIHRAKQRMRELLRPYLNDD